ncbi:MAG: hypothetical protein DME59_18975 [Verrucomicrobia bacterium]|nr:MAG: hypothetical protein DME59_18975 [Verrucomicrobiota bacterium]PYL78023.1 MAG: hypothetical protein DMF26_01980 [Verrucomicrobiota bacterium]
MTYARDPHCAIVRKVERLYNYVVYQPETRARRIKNACSMLAAGKRRVCSFDRSGFYSKSLSAPKAAT